MGRLLDRFRRHSWVAAYLALFVALGGSAYAVVELDKNEVKSKHIKNRGVKTKDLADNAVTSPKVADGTLLGKDFAAGQLPQGPQGEQGPQGVGGATNVTVRSTPDTVPAGGLDEASVDCNAGERAVGGGWEVTGGSVQVSAYQDHPTPRAGTPTGWRVTVDSTGPAPTNYSVYVICASP